MSIFSLENLKEIGITVFLTMESSNFSKASLICKNCIYQRFNYKNNTKSSSINGTYTDICQTLWNQRQKVYTVRYVMTIMISILSYRYKYCLSAGHGCNNLAYNFEKSGIRALAQVVRGWAAFGFKCF